MKSILRQETVTDRRAVEELVREAFWNVYQPGCNTISTCSASPPPSSRS